MKGRAPSAAQKRWHDLVASVGCVACSKDGDRNSYVSIHHIAGRTSDDAHWLVLPLCAGHHQHNTGALGFVAIHPYKARFERLYGTQESLLATVCYKLRSSGHKLPDEVEAIINALTKD